MIDYSSWPRKKISVGSLKLDNQNPRLSGFGTRIPSESEIIHYLLEHENIVQLAKDIIAIGYLPNEEPIVYKDDRKYIVLEGNRRVSACKIITDPTLVPHFNSKKKAVNRLVTSSSSSSFVQSLNVIVAPSREAADVLIVNRHTKGSSIEKWDKTKQDRFFAARHRDSESIDEMAEKFNLPKSAIKDSLTRFYFFEELLELDLSEKDKENLADETKLKMTNVERFYKSKKGKQFLGVEFDSKGQIIHQLPKLEYQARLKKIAVDVLDDTLNSRSYGEEKAHEKYLASIIKSTEFNMSIVADRAFQYEYDTVKIVNSENSLAEQNKSLEGKSKSKILSSISADNKLIPPSAANWKSDNIRINKIFKELKDANLDERFNATAVLFRSYLDMLAYQYLNKKDKIKELIKDEQRKIDNETAIKIKKGIDFIVSLGVEEGDINHTLLKKALGAKTGVSQNWVPSLRQMLLFIVSSEDLLPDIKLRQALSSYLKGNEGYLSHNDLNLLVHNEYFLKGKQELKDTWEHLYPLLSYLNDDI